MEYWDKRYEQDKGDTYDWLGGYSRFKEFIEKAVENIEGCDKETVRILDLGCGNARLAEDMYDNGYRGITALDLSPAAIETMKERNEGKRVIEWVVGDAFALDFEDASFDIVIDKSTTDAVSCMDQKHTNLCKMTAEVSRVLRTGGYYLVFSSVNNVPRMSLSMPHLKFEWEETEIEVPFTSLSAFVCKKAPMADIALTMRYQESLEYFMEVDRRQKEAAEMREAAEQRLKEQASSSNLAVLD